MTYTILIQRQAKKTLQNLSRPDRHRITEKIVALGIDPDDQMLDVKRLMGLPYYRLRVGNWEKVKPRGGAYK